jgi:hypothetical protein
VETLHKEFLKMLNEAIDKNPDKADKIDIESIISEVAPDAVKLIKGSLMKSAKGMLKERRKLSYQFEKRNIKRWEKAFDILETHCNLLYDRSNYP